MTKSKVEGPTIVSNARSVDGLGLGKLLETHHPQEGGRLMPWDHTQMANLGTGIPKLVANYVGDKNITLQSETAC